MGIETKTKINSIKIIPQVLNTLNLNDSNDNLDILHIISRRAPYLAHDFLKIPLPSTAKYEPFPYFSIKTIFPNIFNYTKIISK